MLSEKRNNITTVNGCLRKKLHIRSESDEVDEEVIYSQAHRSLQRWWTFTEILTGSWIDLLSTDYQLKNHFSF